MIFKISKKNIVLLCLKIFFTFINSVDHDEMQHYAAFHLGLHCLQKHPFRGFPNIKGSAIFLTMLEMPSYSF